MPIALITGASRGIGRSAALHLARAGWDVVGTFLHSRDRAESLVEDIEREGRRAAVLPFDAEEPASIDGFVVAVREVLRSTFDTDTFQALVNNAGIGTTQPFAETTEEQFDRLVAIQFKTPYFLTQRLLPVIADGGTILNVSSGLARFVVPGASAYAATKGAMEVVTRYQAQELGRRGIRVNAIAPGAVANDFNGGTIRDDPDANRGVSASIALGRPGESDEIGAAMAALLSSDLRWMSGTRIEVSGGQKL